jgi:hypothetical protein
MVVILLATGAATRLAEVGLASAVRLTTAAGGGYLTPDDLVAADARHIGFGLLRLLLPGLLIQALLIKLVVGAYRGLQISYFATAAVLGMFAVGSLGLAAVTAQWFADSPSLHALTPLSPATLYVSLALSAATFVAEAFVLQGLVEQPVGRYPLTARRAA